MLRAFVGAWLDLSGRSAAIWAAIAWWGASWALNSSLGKTGNWIDGTSHAFFWVLVGLGLVSAIRAYLSGDQFAIWIVALSSFMQVLLFGLAITNSTVFTEVQIGILAGLIIALASSNFPADAADAEGRISIRRLKCAKRPTFRWKS